MISELSRQLSDVRDLVAQDMDVPAALMLSDRLAEAPDIEFLISAALEMARLSPQPSARVIAGAALARLRPNFASTWRQVAGIAQSAADYVTAADMLCVAAETPEGGPQDRLGAALCAYQANDFDRAEALYRGVGGDDALCGLAVVAIARGETPAAAAILREVLSRSPARHEALRLLAMIDPDMATLETLARTARDERQAPHYRSAAAFALSQASDRAGDPVTASAWAEMANAMSPSRAFGYDPVGNASAFQALVDLTDRLPVGPPLLGGPRPIVIVGLPRSGTSLLESILAAHPEVSAGGERSELLLASREIDIVLRGKGADAAARLFERRREGLVRELEARIARAGFGTSAYLDKMPLNTPYAGLIARLLPEARVIFVRRDPVETALSIWLHDFSPAYPYACDLDALGHAVALNDTLRAEWAARLGDRFLDLDHDALCADPETEARRLFGFCGLDWNPAYITPERRSSAVNTFSALQVRQPIRTRPPRAPAYPREAAALRDAMRRAA